MAFKTIKLVHFRNLADAEIELLGKVVFLVGENGQGKTNFLEALYFCSYASSFRGSRDSDMVKSGEKACSCIATLDGSAYTTVLVKIENGRKSIELDEKKAADRKELLESSPCIVFCHQDISFVSGSPEERRWFFDQSQSLTDSVYLDDLRRFKRILKTRTSVFKDDQYVYAGALNHNGRALLESLDAQFAEYG
jgi:DNA replication and repair protein RecF